MQATSATTIDDEEVERFSRMAEEWWDPHGKFKPLHQLNPTRIEYIVEKAGPLAGKTLLDIGCGGGLISEPMARLGAKVTGVDASGKNIAVAKLHAEQGGLKIDYRVGAAEALTEQFDVVLALEIVEHVADVDLFVASCLKLVKPGGILIMSTLNRTLKSFAFAIVGAEYVLQWLPKGTHQWEKFLKPHELVRAVESHGGKVIDLTGMVMHPLTFKWSLSKKDLSVNYLLTATV